MIGVSAATRPSSTRERTCMPVCEIIYVKSPNGWKWRLLDGAGAQKAPARSEETYELFYECVTAARARGYQLNIRCL